jgi:HemY protein
MKRLLVFLVIALVVGGAVGTLMARDPGYVLVTFEDMSFETSLWFALLALFVGYFAVRLVFWTVMKLIRSGTGVAAWRQNRRTRAAQIRTIRGLLFAGEGDWTGARKALLADVEHVESPLINYVGAARAANEMGDVAERDELLKKAGESTTGSALAVALTQAELQIAARQHRSAIETLLTAKVAAPNQSRISRLLADCYEQIGDWKALLALVPELQRRNVMSADQLQASRLHWSIAFFRHPPSGADVAQQLIVQWNALDNDVRSDPGLIAACADALIIAGANSEAEAVLSKALKQNWNDDLVALYGRVRAEPADRQIATAEGWLKSRPNDATLLLALGRISLAGRNWTKAREYFEASLKQRRSAEVYGELGRLCLAMGERPRATELLAQALDMGGQLPALPLPETPTGDANAARS